MRISDYMAEKAPFWLRYYVRRFKICPVHIDEIVYSEMYRDEYYYVKKRPYSSEFPYTWAESYKVKDYPFYRDSKGSYNLINGKKLYWAESTYTPGAAARQIKALCMEQDERSPHHYFSDKVNVDDDTVLFDIGAGEGLISLLNIDKVKKAYIFEADEERVKALKYTYEPYMDKVEIVDKYVSNHNDMQNTTLETYIERHTNDKCVFKIDIEGMETDVIPAAFGDYWGKENMQFACCTYHKKGDADYLEHIFSSAGYSTEFSNGFMLMRNPIEFRRGLIRAWKENS